MLTAVAGTDAGDNWLFKGVLLESTTKLVEVRSRSTVLISCNTHPLKGVEDGLRRPGSSGRGPREGEFRTTCTSDPCVSVQSLTQCQGATPLDEDALILWRAALRHTNTLDGVKGQPGLFDLAPLALQLLESNLDLLGKIVSIVKSYVLLDASRLLQVSPPAPLQ